MTELENVSKSIFGALCCEDIFGESSSGNLEEHLKRVFRQLSKVVHPDLYTNPDDKEMANETFQQLGELYASAQKKAKNGTYGQRINSKEAESGFVIKTGKREYKVKITLAQGDLSVVYGGNCLDENGLEMEIAVKVVGDPADNDLMKNESKVLKLFQSSPCAQSKHLPVLLDQFKTSENQLGIILRYIDGYDLYSVCEKYKQGISQIHAAWILERLLSVAGYAHSKGVVHCNIEPSHIMVSPSDHNVFLIDWSYAAINPSNTGDGFKIINEDFSPPEIADRKHPIPASDMYSIGKCMIYALGGDIKNNSIPQSVDKRLQRFIRFFVRESSRQRAQDAWEMYEQLKKLRSEIFGQKRFIEFRM